MHELYEIFTYCGDIFLLGHVIKFGEIRSRGSRVEWFYSYGGSNSRVSRYPIPNFQRPRQTQTF